MRDSFERTIDYMRISVTDRCNLRCIYCMPAEGVRPIEHKSILRYEEIIRIARVAAGLGVRKIRLTGGEPLTRRNLTFLVSAVSAIEGIEDVSLTTNGLLLRDLAPALAGAGLKRVNVSLDSLRPERYRELTRGGDLAAVLEGIRAAEAAGLTPVKLNMVPVRGFNDDEIEAFAHLTTTTAFHVRFIEFMPIGGRELWTRERCITADEIRQQVSTLGPLHPVKERRCGPARYYRFENAPGVIGFISALTHHFCDNCNRLRLTADGKIRPCLFSETEIDMKSALRNGAPDEEIARLLRLAIEIKPRGHSIDPGGRPAPLKPMSRIGG